MTASSRPYYKLSAVADTIQQVVIGETVALDLLRDMGVDLRTRHDHADPCEIDSGCPCCEAGQQYARDNIEPPCKR